MTELEISNQMIQRLGLSNQYLGLNQKTMVSCPYHEDKHPSASIKITDEGRALFHCFSCGMGNGTLRSVFRDIKGHSINRELDIPFEKQDEDNIKSLFEKEKTEINYSIPPEVYFSMTGSFLPVEKSSLSREYLKKRCITKEVADSMKMKFAINAKSFYTDNKEDKTKWVNFTNRLIIPIYENGKLISCEGRDLEGKKVFESRMKQRGIENCIYKKCIYPTGASTSTLYQLDKLDKSKTLFFVEGLMDLAVLRTDKFFNETNSTAIFGANITQRQLFLLKQFDSFCYICDYDKAGFLSLKKLYNVLSNDNQFTQKDWRFILPPFTNNGVKDIGDVPVKIGKSIEQCRNMKWLNTSKLFCKSQSLIDKYISQFAGEK